MSDDTARADALIFALTILALGVTIVAGGSAWIAGILVVFATLSNADD